MNAVVPKLGCTLESSESPGEPPKLEMPVFCQTRDLIGLVCGLGWKRDMENTKHACFFIMNVTNHCIE